MKLLSNPISLKIDEQLIETSGVFWGILVMFSISFFQDDLI
jgi:hypothetical protein